MKETLAGRWRRVRRRCAQAGGMLLAFALVGLTAACSREPSEKKLRTQATSPLAESRRAEEEHKIRTLIERLTAVEGLEHVLTRFTDSCARPSNGSIFENNRSPYVLTCGMKAVGYFGVQGNITDVLPRIRAAGIATWGMQDGKGRDLPHAGGTVSYALDYHRKRGRNSGGSLMPAPDAHSPGAPDRLGPAGPPAPEPGRGPRPVPSSRDRDLPALLYRSENPDEHGGRTGPVRHHPDLHPRRQVGLLRGELLHRAPPEVTHRS